MMPCIFCRIVAGLEPAACIYEDEHVLAFLDRAQVTTGHTLVIPKQHYRNLLEMDRQAAAHLFEPIPEISRKLMAATGALGLNLVSNNEPAANQQVFHTHLHLIPRFKEDGVCLSSTAHNCSFDMLRQLAKQMKQV